MQDDTRKRPSVQVNLDRRQRGLIGSRSRFAAMQDESSAAWASVSAAYQTARRGAGATMNGVPFPSVSPEDIEIRGVKGFKTAGSATDFLSSSEGRMDYLDRLAASGKIGLETYRNVRERRDASLRRRKPGSATDGQKRRDEARGLAGKRLLDTASRASSLKAYVDSRYGSYDKLAAAAAVDPWEAEKARRWKEKAAAQANLQDGKSPTRLYDPGPEPRRDKGLRGAEYENQRRAYADWLHRRNQMAEQESRDRGLWLFRGGQAAVDLNNSQRRLKALIDSTTARVNDAAAAVVSNGGSIPSSVMSVAGIGGSAGKPDGAKADDQRIGGTGDGPTAPAGGTAPEDIPRWEIPETFNGRS